MSTAPLLTSHALPHEPLTERHCLGWLLTEGKLIGERAGFLDLEPADFFINPNRQVFLKVLELESYGKPFDWFEVAASLDGTSMNWPAFLTALVSEAPHRLDMRVMAQRLRMLRTRREVIQICNATVARAKAAGSAPLECISEFESAVFDMQSRRKQSEGFVAMPAAIAATTAILERRLLGQERGIGTGFVALDALMHGWHKQSLCILAARPGMGKTALALNFAINAAKADKARRIAIFTMEMMKEQLMQVL